MTRTLTRRRILASGLAAGVTGAQLASSASAQDKAAKKQAYDTIVVGAGVFGAWTAWWLRRAGQRVLLLDALGAGNARASSGGESRITRSSYGSDEIYTRFAVDSLAHWKWLNSKAGLPLFHKSGVLFFFQKREAYAEASIAAHRKLGLATQVLDRAALEQRYPQGVWKDVELALFEPEFGALMARRAVQTLVSAFQDAGGAYRIADVQPPAAESTLAGIEARGADGAVETLTATQYVFACGPWLPKVFPRLLGSRIFTTRQEVFFFAPPRGDARFAAGMPCWADFNGGDIYYGTPDLENRGFKIARDKHGLPIDPDRGDRIASPGALADVRAYLAKRFPALAGAQLNEERVCQYENSGNGDLLIDRHPTASNVVLVGAGSGHGFKHGPEVGRYAALLVSGKLPKVEPRFSLTSKAESQNRAVH